MSEGRKVLATNRKARHDYFIEDSFEVGMSLVGTEVKSLRQGKTNLKDSYAFIKNNEVFIHGMHVSPYKQGNINNVDPLRERKLLLHSNEINRLQSKVSQKGYVLIPLKLYLKRGIVKMELAIAKGKKLYDKRDSIAKRDAKREMDRKIKEHTRN